MGTAERRNAIMRILCRRRHETIQNLASEFGVSERTIRRDIDVLSYTEPIYTQTGRHTGGVYVMDGYAMDRMFMTDAEVNVLCKLYNATPASILSKQESAILQRIITNYTKPSQRPDGK